MRYTLKKLSITNYKLSIILVIVFGLLFIFSLLFIAPKTTDAASLSISPANSTEEVGDTFEVSIFLNTEGKDINTIVADLSYPSDKMQIVSSGSGTSVIKFWTTPPEFNNQTGILRLSGGIPNGINTNRGLIATLTFRAKKTGTGVLRFVGETQTYLNDGNGTEALSNTFSGVYTLVLPPPEGPIVSSTTHPDQNTWYPRSDLVLNWENDFDSDDAYSYILDDQPTTIPDNTPEDNRKTLTYRDLDDGTHYFHIKALRDGIWGGVTHFAINIDKSEPADFPIKVLPSSRTTSPRPTFEWSTTDEYSGVNFYELKIVPRTPDASPGTEQLFIEVSSPYLTEDLKIGEYDVIVRAHDNAGNVRTVTKQFEVTESLFKFITEGGIAIGDKIIMPWWVFFLIMTILLAAVAVLARYAYKEHQEAEARLQSRDSGSGVPPEVSDKLKELEDFKNKYGKKLMILLVAGSLVFGGQALAQNDDATGGERVILNPPIVETISRDLSNEEIFYIGGVADTRDMEVVIYMQNLWTAETISRTVETDENREWFYRHNTFLQRGVYLVWTQGKLQNQVSPPSSQIQVEVESTAFAFGASRISYEALYLALSIILLLISVGLAAFALHHRKHAKEKHARVMNEVREAEESIRRGFGILKQDIKAELDIIKKARFNKELTEEKEKREEQLLKDLQEIENKIGKEVWDIRDAENE